MNAATLGAIIILASMTGGLFFCLGVCLILWIRYKNKSVPSLWSKALLQQPKSLNYDNKSAETPHADFSMFPTISYSETGSEPCSPVSNLSTYSPLTPYGGRTFQTFLEHSGRPEGGGISLRETSLISSYVKRRQSPIGVNQGASYISKLPPTLPKSRQARPSSLHLRTPSNTPSVSSAAPSSESGTSTSPADFESLKSPFRFPELLISKEGRTSFVSVQPLDVSDKESSYPNKESEQMHKFKLGIVKVKLHYSAAQNILKINLLRNFQLPYHIHCQESNIYAKFNLTVGKCRYRYSTTLRPSDTSDQADSEVAATFQQKVLSDELLQTCVVITLCKVVKAIKASDQGMVIGSAFVNLKDLSLSKSEDTDTGVLDLPLGDSTPHQMILCGGSLHAILELPLESSCLSLTHIRLRGMDFSKIFSRNRSEDRKEYVQLYLKMTVYEKGEAVFWRRTTTVNVSTSCEEVVMASQMFLEFTPRNLNTLQLVLSVRLKTGKLSSDLTFRRIK